MMQIQVSTHVDAAPDAVREYLLSDAFHTALAHATDLVRTLEETEREELVEGRLRRITTYTAPTRLPRALRRYEARAPREVSWDEIAVWKLRENRAEYTIRAHAPDTWHEKYDSQGQIRIEPADGGSRVTETLDFSLHVALIGRALEKALKAEIEELFQTRLHVVQRHFRSS